MPKNERPGLQVRTGGASYSGKGPWPQRSLNAVPVGRAACTSHAALRWYGGRFGCFACPFLRTVTLLQRLRWTLKTKAAFWHQSKQDHLADTWSQLSELLPARHAICFRARPTGLPLARIGKLLQGNLLAGHLLLELKQELPASHLLAKNPAPRPKKPEVTARSLRQQTCSEQRRWRKPATVDHQHCGEAGNVAARCWQQQIP